MNASPEEWLKYAEDNLLVAEQCYNSGLYNPCLQNSQQAVEKALKCIALDLGLELKYTHNISVLSTDLENAGTPVDLSEDEREFLDSIYLPSKYPLGSALPRFEPNEMLAKQCINLAEHMVKAARRRLKG